MVAVTGVVPLLVAVNEGIFPLPFAARPIVVLLFVQVYVVPDTKPEKLTADVAVLLQTTWLATLFTDGVGLIVTGMIEGVRLQTGTPELLYTTGVMVRFVVTGAAVGF